MNSIQKVSLFYILLLATTVYGFAVGRFKVFPYEIINPFLEDYLKFAAGDPMEKKTSVASKLKNDLGLSNDRWTYPYPGIAAEHTSRVTSRLFENRDVPPLMYIADGQRSGYRVIVGAFDFPGSFWGAILIDPDGDILHHWNLSTAHLPHTARSARLKNLYGVHVFPDGSMIFTMQEQGGGIVKVDACSNILWSIEGDFHHAVSPDESGHFWTFTGSQGAMDQDMALFSVATGDLVRTIKMKDVRAANPYIHIWDLYPFSLSPDREKIYSHGNITHGNDIDPLPEALAADFPMFAPGDLLVSYATTNLLFVLDPGTLEVKWWRVGAGGFQHDPDWEPGGKISIFSNNARRRSRTSDIVTIDALSFEQQVSVDGAHLQFRSPINGRHQLTDFNTVFVTSAQQGWAFEVDLEGKIIFSFVNSVDSETTGSPGAAGEALHLSEAWRYPESYFDTRFWLSCSNQKALADL